VRRVGSDVSTFKAGDAVVAVTGHGAFAQEALVDASQAILLPADANLEAAAAFMFAHGTSYHALKDRAQLRAGETLLVLGASGGVGLAAVELGKLMGARVIAAASSEEKLATCRARGADATINYATEDLRQRAKELAGERGVDVVYDPVGGAYSEPALRTMAWGGRFLVVGFAAGEIPKDSAQSRAPQGLLDRRRLLGRIHSAGAGKERAKYAGAARMAESRPRDSAHLRSVSTRAGSRGAARRSQPKGHGEGGHIAVNPRARSLAILLVVASFQASAEKRVALIVGNHAYPNSDRIEERDIPRRDAADVAAVATRLGFETKLLLDATHAQFDEALSGYYKALDEATSSFLYFSGAAAQAGGDNLLLPVDVDINTVGSLRDKAFSVQAIRRAIEGSRSLHNLVVLEAGWTFPPARMLGLKEGLGFPAPGIGGVITAQSGLGVVSAPFSRNSIFTAALLRHMESAHEFAWVSKRVIEEVGTDTAGRQSRSS
jgi:hypothetical protein